LLLNIAALIASCLDRHYNERFLTVATMLARSAANREYCAQVICRAVRD
jgi:hypothetical protein